MSFIRTVLGDIPSDELGICYAHEHIIIDTCYATEKFPDFLLKDTDKAVLELKEFHDNGGRAMVDSMPCACGRNVLKMAEVSRRSGVHLLVPTGAHLEIYYPAGHWTGRLTAEELAELFVSDIEHGIDANDYNGPQVQRTDHRAGLIKIAGDLDGISERNAGVFEAAALAHRRTGCPILTHTEQGTGALQQIELLSSMGVDLSHVVLSHTDRKPDLIYHREILSTGVNVEYDSCFRWKENSSNHSLELLGKLSGQYGNQLLLGMDAARRSYWKTYGGHPGLSFLLKEFSAAMKDAGLSDAFLHKVFVSNPARVYAFGGVRQR